MDQFHQIGEVLGGIRALMVFQDDIQINQKQCCFLLESLISAFDRIADEMRTNLRYEDKHTKCRILESPLKELCRVFKESEAYIKRCFEVRDWWAKAVSLYQNRDCVEFHIHNLLSVIPMVVGAIESAGELSSSNSDEIDDHIRRRRHLLSKKYHNEWFDKELFRWKFGKQYLISPEFCKRMDAVWKEDRWILLDRIQEKRASGFATKHQQRLMNILTAILNDSNDVSAKILPTTVLLGSKDYQVRRRIGKDSEYKEISWLGETFVLRHIKGDIEPVIPEISQLLSLSHPNILQLLCAFTDEDRKECFLLTELMNKDLSTHMKELATSRKKVSLSLLAEVDIMLQIARGMEYLHSKKVYHGDLSTSKILVKPRSGSGDGLLHTKVSGIGLPSFANQSSNPEEAPTFIWHAPEVLAEQDELGSPTVGSKYSEKSDVYSFAMVCFEILTGKVPFEDSHLHGDKMSRNIRTGERPLFPFHCPKYVITLIKKCWHSDPSQRPSFSAITRVLRYIKHFLVMNPDHYSAATDPPPTPLVDYYEIEMGLQRRFPSWRSSGNNYHPRVFPVSEIPFQMFAYRVMEREKLMGSFTRDTCSESGSEGTASMSGDEAILMDIEVPFVVASGKRDNLLSASINRRLSSLTSRSAESKGNKNPGSEASSLSGDETTHDSFPLKNRKSESLPNMLLNKRLSALGRSAEVKSNKYPGTPKGKSERPPQLTRSSRSMNIHSGMKMAVPNPRIRRKSGHASDSDI